MTASSEPTPSGEAPTGCGDGASYAFGDVDLAARRLQLLDQVFAEPSRRCWAWLHPARSGWPSTSAAARAGAPGS